jgi:hypothetical protein
LSASCGPDLSARLVRGAFPPGSRMASCRACATFWPGTAGAPSSEFLQGTFACKLFRFQRSCRFGFGGGKPFFEGFVRKPALPRSSWRGGATRRDEIGRIREGSVADCCRGSPALVGNPWRKMKDRDQEPGGSIAAFSSCARSPVRMRMKSDITSCGEEVPDGRLEIDPAFHLCVKCAE